MAVRSPPDEAMISTSIVERQNLSIRNSMKRITCLTCAFSKKWDNLRAALALSFAAYNFTRTHRSIRMTSAMKAGGLGRLGPSRSWLELDGGLLVTARHLLNNAAKTGPS